MNGAGIVLRLRGGLGNQLFQAAAGSFYARKFEVPVILDDSVLIRHKLKSRRSWIREIELMKLFGNERVRLSNRFYSRFNSYKSIDSRRCFLEQDDLDKMESVHNTIYVYDWFHSSKFLPSNKVDNPGSVFRNIRTEIRKKGERIRLSNKLGAIHIRLGDFKQTSWGILSPEWYLSAVQEMIKRGISEVHCYSDDVREAGELLGPLSHNLKFEFPETKDELLPHELLWIFMQYQTFASSNSSLSWWASYLNVHEDSVIYSAWKEDLHFEGWIRLS